MLQCLSRSTDPFMKALSDATVMLVKSGERCQHIPTRCWVHRELVRGVRLAGSLLGPWITEAVLHLQLQPLRILELLFNLFFLLVVLTRKRSSSFKVLSSHREGAEVRFPVSPTSRCSYALIQHHHRVLQASFQDERKMVGFGELGDLVLPH